METAGKGQGMQFTGRQLEVPAGRLTRQHEVSISVADEVEGVSDRVRTRGAGGGGSMVRAQQPVLHAHHSGSHVGQQPGHHKRAQPAKKETRLTWTSSVLLRAYLLIPKSA